MSSTIICGGRDITDYAFLKYSILQCPWQITEIISGGCRGVDNMGEKYAMQNDIDLIVAYANWGKYGKGAGWDRNRKMVDRLAEKVLAIWDGKSPGTKHCIDYAKSKALEVYISYYP